MTSPSPGDATGTGSGVQSAAKKGSVRWCDLACEAAEPPLKGHRSQSDQGSPDGGTLANEQRPHGADTDTSELRGDAQQNHEAQHTPMIANPTLETSKVGKAAEDIAESSGTCDGAWWKSDAFRTVIGFLSGCAQRPLRVFGVNLMDPLGGLFQAFAPFEGTAMQWVGKRAYLGSYQCGRFIEHRHSECTFFGALKQFDTNELTKAITEAKADIVVLGGPICDSSSSPEKREDMLYEFIRVSELVAELIKKSEKSRQSLTEQVIELNLLASCRIFTAPM